MTKNIRQEPPFLPDMDRIMRIYNLVKINKSFKHLIISRGLKCN